MGHAPNVKGKDGKPLHGGQTTPSQRYTLREIWNGSSTTHDFQTWILNLQDQADIQAAGMHQGQLQQGQQYYDPSTGMLWFTNGNYGPVPPTVPTQHYPATAPATAPTATTPIMRAHTHTHPTAPTVLTPQPLTQMTPVATPVTPMDTAAATSPPPPPAATGPSQHVIDRAPATVKAKPHLIRLQRQHQH